MKQARQQPLIFDIHRYALDDGPGIRTTVFFKGCPLSCLWCHNPEGISVTAELYYHVQKCISCGECASICEHGAVTVNDDHILIDRSRCNLCGACADRCPATALIIKGRHYAVDELVDVILQDRRFFENSSGGVTFSGGEPTLHMDYLEQVARRLKTHDIHLALQTCGFFDWDRFSRQLLPLIDLIYFDVKGVDPDLHHQWTGRSNEIILANLAHLAGAAGEKLVCSVPLVDGFTTREGNVHAVADLIGCMTGVPYRLHPYHPGAVIKHAALGTAGCVELPGRTMDPEDYHRIATTFDTIVSQTRHGK